MSLHKNSFQISLAIALTVTIALSACGKRQPKAVKKAPDSQTAPLTTPSPTPAAPETLLVSDPIKTTAISNELVGTWVSPCLSSEERYFREKLVVQADGKFEKIIQNYLEDSCETPAEKENKHGGFVSYGTIVSASENIKAIDLTINTLSSRTIYQLKNGNLCFGDAMSAPTSDDRPSQISCTQSYTRI